MSKSALTFVGILFVVLSSHALADAGQYSTLHKFCSKADCPDGVWPNGAPVRDAAGNLYGTTQAGGSLGFGTIYEIDASGFHTIYTFCNCGDGIGPLAPLIVDAEGNLYGTTAETPVVFELQHPVAGRKKWKYRTLYAFGSCECTDGAEPRAALAYAGQSSGQPYDGVSPLFGTTAGGGANSAGTVFELAHRGDQWTERVLYNFCSVGDCTDGARPIANVVVQGKNLFGLTQLGGNEQSAGVAFELSPGNGDLWNEAVLYSFCSKANCADGNQPFGSLTPDGQKGFYGTTVAGGGPCDDSGGCGVVFHLDAGNTETVLHAFCTKAGCPDGRYPYASPIIKGHTLYGTTGAGGGHGNGVVFRLKGTKYKILYSFCSESNCADGSIPQAPVIMDELGSLYGTASNGGHGTYGVVFRLTQ